MSSYAWSVDASLSVEASVSGSILPIEASASIAASYGHSSAMSDSKKAKKDGKLRQFNQSAIATLFSYTLNSKSARESLSPEFLDTLNKVENEGDAFRFA